MSRTSLVRSAVILLSAGALALSLTACGGDDSPTSTDDFVSGASNPGGDIPDSAGEPDAADAGSGELPDELGDFPVPDTYTVLMAGTQGSATTVLLKDIPGHWAETKAFYETELAAIGWEITGDRPFITKGGTELDAVKGDVTATVGISYIDNKTSVVINLVKS